MKKLIFALLVFVALLLVGCNIPMDKLDISNGTEYVVKGKRVSKDGYAYNLLKVGDSWYDFLYKDTANFNVGDTIVITVRRVNN